MSVGGLALIHSAVRWFGVVQHYCVTQNPSVGCRRVWRDTRQTHSYNLGVQSLPQRVIEQTERPMAPLSRRCGGSLNVHG